MECDFRALGKEKAKLTAKIRRAEELVGVKDRAEAKAAGLRLSHASEQISPDTEAAV